MSKKFAVNENVKIAGIGTLINEAISANEDGRTDSLHDILLEVHSAIYPNASRPATPEEYAALAAAEPKGCIHPESVECVSTCSHREDSLPDIPPRLTPEEVSKISDIEDCLNKLESYIHIIESFVENATVGKGWGIKAKHLQNCRVISYGTTSAMLVMTGDARDQINMALERLYGRNRCHHR